MGDSIREDTYKGNTIDPDLVDLFNKLFEEISMLDENKPVRKWNIFLSHALRRYETNPGGSDHYKGNAIDIKIMRYDKNGDKPVDYVLGGNYQPELLKVMDILYTNHRNEFNQAILEYKTTNTMKSDTVYNFHVLHISSNRGKHKGSHQMFIASADKNYGSINKNCKTKEWFLENVPDGFKSIAKKVYYNDRTYFNNFNNYVTFGNYTNSELRAHFGENVFAKKFNDIGYTKSNGNLSTKLNNPGSLRKLPNELWLGEVRPNDSGFVKFENMYYGTRALFLNMNTQITRGHNTISKLINVWAPPSENDTKQYIYNVCKGANVSEDTLLTNIIDDKDLCVEIARQIAIAEDGIKLTDECLQTSYDMACKYIRRKMT